MDADYRPDVVEPTLRRRLQFVDHCPRQGSRCNEVAARRHFICLPRTMRAMLPRPYGPTTAAGSCDKVPVRRARRLYDGLGKESRHDDTRWVGEEGTGVSGAVR